MAIFGSAYAIDMTKLKFLASVGQALECGCYYPETEVQELNYYSESSGVATEYMATGLVEVEWDEFGNYVSSSGYLDGFTYQKYVVSSLPAPLVVWYLYDTYITVEEFETSSTLERLQILFSGEDEIAGSYFSDKLYGFAGDDWIDAWYGNDIIDGGAGADLMNGGKGNDTFYVDDLGDLAVERDGGGTDKVFTSVSYTLKAQYVENLTLTGSDDINATGNKLANTILGNAGSNVINGMRGADLMTGGAGDDSYFVDNVGDVVAELADEGHDTVNSTISFSLVGLEVEDLALLGSSSINGTGNGFANSITGNSGGTNILNGLEGNDTLTGGGGADRFVFTTALGIDNIDVITDFYAPRDSIRIDNAIFVGLTEGLLLPDQFKDIATGPADETDRILYDSTTGALFFDQDGTGTDYEAVQFATIANLEPLTYRDFLVI
ncbi:calcium-binding protein [Corticibacterium sp. UT-5YL-CI-8]|nr:calcium-binding protein [Tianweitania sp. UT-5YL-CI-8]